MPVRKSRARPFARPRSTRGRPKRRRFDQKESISVRGSSRICDLLFQRGSNAPLGNIVRSIFVSVRPPALNPRETETSPFRPEGVDIGTGKFADLRFTFSTRFECATREHCPIDIRVRSPARAQPLSPRETETLPFRSSVAQRY